MSLKYVFFFLFIFQSVSAQSDKSIVSFVASATQSSALRHATWALYAEDIESGKVLVNTNAEKSLAPASGLKLFTSAAALELLGSDFKFETQLFYRGRLAANGQLDGDIIIRGSGDPTLGSALVPGSMTMEDLLQNWVKTIRNAGIRSISGSVIADATLFEDSPIPGNWLWVDMGNYYGTGVSALSINDNLYTLVFQPGIKPGSPAKVLRTEPKLPKLQFDNQMLTGKPGSGDNGYIFRAPNANIATLRGTIPAGVDEFSIKGSLPDPAFLYANTLRDHLNQNGITVYRPAQKINKSIHYNDVTLLVSTYSPRLSEIVEVLNKRSVNHIAEQLLFALSVDSIRSGKRAVGLKRIKKFLTGLSIDTGALNLEDGSGLSPNNLISAKMMAQLLGKMEKRRSFEAFYNSMSLAGDPDDVGFFKSFGRNSVIEKKCRIKSGLIQGVRSHSGYLTTKSGRLIAFSFIANNLTKSYRKIDKIHETLLVHLAENY